MEKNSTNLQKIILWSHLFLTKLLTSVKSRDTIHLLFQKYLFLFRFEIKKSKGKFNLRKER